MSEIRFTVALDGPAAAGKGTIARALAARFGFVHLDTGLLYRATGMKALAQADGAFTEGEAAFAARSLTPMDLKANGLRSGAAGEAASRVAAIPAVRAALLDFQREFARRPGRRAASPKASRRARCAASLPQERRRRAVSGAPRRNLRYAAGSGAVRPPLSQGFLEWEAAGGEFRSCLRE